MNLLILGTVAFDSIKTPFGTAERVLGGSALYAALAAHYFCKPEICAAVGHDFLPEHAAVLRQRGIDISHLDRLPGLTFSWSGEYGLDLNQRQTLFTKLGVLEQFNPIFHNHASSIHYAFLGNVAPQQQLKLLDQLPPSCLTACDTMNFWIKHNKAELLEVLSRVPIVILNDFEARELTQTSSLVKAIQILATMLASRLGLPPTVVIKRGEYGVLVYQEKKWFHVPGLPLEQVVDPTGAGDVFGGAFMGYLAAHNSASWAVLKQAVVYGSVLASFCVEQFGTAGIEDISMVEIAQRYAVFKALTDFEYQELNML